MTQTQTSAGSLVKLDIGCGINKKAGYLGVDIKNFAGVDVVADLRNQWPWEDNSVDEVNASHVLEHFTATERIHFMNELYRVLKPGSKATIITPHWSSARAYGDLTHQWPPVSEFWYYYLSKEWRKTNAPHQDDQYSCDFEATWGYNLRPDLASRNQDYQMFAMCNYKEAAQDIIATVTKKA